MHRWEEECQSGRGLVMDGGMGTLLEDRGLEVSTPLWASAALLTPEGRAEVEAAHRAYVSAGADMVIANTHNASLDYTHRWLKAVPAEDRPGVEPDPERLMTHLNAMAIASARTTGARFVAASLASPDQPYTHRATLSVEEVRAAVEPQIAVLASTAPDLLIAEMCTTAHDVRGIATAFEAVDTPVGFGFVVTSETTLLDGTSLEAAVAAAEPCRPAALFIQCTPYPAVAGALARLAEISSVHVGAYGNDGRGWGPDGWEGHRVEPEAYAEAAETWWRLGARLVGGCCGTTPEHIASLARRIRGPGEANAPRSPSPGGDGVA